MITRANSFSHLLYIWLPPIIWMALIFVASSRPGTSYPDLGSLDFAAKKSAHLLLYAVLYMLLVRAFSTLTWTGRTPRRTYLLSVCVAILYAISDEVHQTFVPAREGTFRDVCIDSLGVLLASLFLRWRGHR